MPDRRQGDRRESSGFQSKKISISLSTFISIIVFIIMTIVLIISCWLSFSKGFNDGYSQGYSDAVFAYDYLDETDNELNNTIE